MSALTEGDSASNQSSRAERELVVVWVSPGSLAAAFALLRGNGQLLRK